MSSMLPRGNWELLEKMNLAWKYADNLSQSGYWFEKAIVQEIRDWLVTSGSPGHLVLDFGCGPRPLAYLFEKFHGQYVGLDVYRGSRVDIVYDGGGNSTQR